jgi:hypothetical protein
MCLSIIVDSPDRLLSEGEAYGFQWVVTHNEMGYRCGYIRLPENHPWHGCDHNSIDASVHGGLTFSECGNYAQPNNGAISSDGTITSINPIVNGIYDVLLWNGTTNAIQQVQLNVVNGKATNSSNAIFAINNNTVSPDLNSDWWIGFCCGHLGDAPDPALPGGCRPGIFSYGKIRTQEYVEEQCKQLCEQALAASAGPLLLGG